MFFCLQGIIIFVIFTANAKVCKLCTDLFKRGVASIKNWRQRQTNFEGSSLGPDHDDKSIDRSDIWIILAAKQLRPKSRCRTISSDSCHSKLTTLTSTGRYFYKNDISKVSKIDCLRFVMCPLLAPVLIGFFSFLFLLRPLTVLTKQTRQTVRAVKQSILLRCQ